MAPSRNLSEALSKINDRYLPGAIEFYAKMSPNPWQEAHDAVELAISDPGGTDYFERVQQAVGIFETRIFELLDQYKPFSLGAKSSPAVVGLYSNSEAQAEDRLSLQEKRCAKCGSAENIRIIKSPRTGRPGIMCRICLPEKTEKK